VEVIDAATGEVRTAQVCLVMPPCFIDDNDNGKRLHCHRGELHCHRGELRPIQFEDQQTRRPVKTLA
jgi:hypothetical protein